MSAARWGDRITPKQGAALVRRILEHGHMHGADAVLLHDLDRMRGRIAALRVAFPSGTQHAVAVKANPVLGVLRACVDAGAGLECASWPEVACSLAAGCSPEAIIFDSPAKTRAELREGLDRGIHLNADNFDELDRIAARVAQAPTTSVIGLRVNPQVGPGSIATTSVAHQLSKMGVPLGSDRAAILERYVAHEWLTGIHVHVGSQGVALEQLVTAARRVVELAQQIEDVAPGRLRHLDLGGGLPVAYRSTDAPISLDAYVAALREAVPELWAGPWRLYTEFGRAVQAGCGLAVSRVEYVKPAGDAQLAVIHLGADLLMRPVYHPGDWVHEFVALDANGVLKTGATIPTDVGGPLCFGGDLVARRIGLPALVPGDLLVVRDTGAYTLSMWSRHCSRTQPAVLGLDEGVLRVLRPAETPADLVRYWGG
ncbi:MAG: diaminopimelate decarboxylase [Myxococcota bacterium]